MEELIKLYNGLDGRVLTKVKLENLTQKFKTLKKKSPRKNKTIAKIELAFKKMNTAIKTTEKLNIKIRKKIPLGLGKISDAGDVRARGRIESYWGDTDTMKLSPEFSKMYNGANRKEKWLRDPEETIKHFNLKSIEFGNWMSQQDRLDFLFLTAISLQHLAKVLNVKDSQIGLNGKLSIALGARGKGGDAAAHYESSDYYVINLTKPHGPGSLAHEYGHALDNAVAIRTDAKNIFISGRSIRMKADPKKEKSNNIFERLMERIFKNLYYSNGKDTSFKTHLKKQQDNYFMRRTEVFARTFESMINKKLKAKKIRNTFLVSGVVGKNYPSVSILKATEKNFNSFVSNAFKTLAKKKR